MNIHELQRIFAHIIHYLPKFVWFIIIRLAELQFCFGSEIIREFEIKDAIKISSKNGNLVIFKKFQHFLKNSAYYGCKYYNDTIINYCLTLNKHKYCLLGAIKSNNYTLVKILKRLGAELKYTNDIFNSTDIRIVKYLCSKYDYINYDEALIKACEHLKNKDIIEFCLDNGAFYSDKVALTIINNINYDAVVFFHENDYHIFIRTISKYCFKLKYYEMYDYIVLL